MAHEETRGWPEGKFTAAHMMKTFKREVPRVVTDLGVLPPGFRGEERLTGSQRLAMQLRITRIMGCPVCLSLFPTLARKAEFDEEQIRDALLGGLGALSPDVAAAADWAGAVVLAGGEEPEEEEDEILTDLQRTHIVAMARIEMLVHSVGLAFLPHRLVEKARAGR